MEPGSPGSRFWQVTFILTPLFLACRQLPSCLSSDGCGDKISGVSPYRNPTPIMKTSPSWLHLTLIISWRSHFQRPSHWGLVLLHVNLVVGGTVQAQYFANFLFGLFIADIQKHNWLLYVDLVSCNFVDFTYSLKQVSCRVCGIFYIQDHVICEKG